MALIVRGTSECPLCGQIIQQGDEVFGTTHFIADKDDPLWRYSNAGFHRHCFHKWEHRQVFVDRYEKFWQEQQRKADK